MNKGEDQIEYVKDRPGHDRRYAIDWSKSKNKLGWEPQHDVKTWMEKTVTWYQQHREWWQNVKTGAYQKYYQQQYGGKV
jgi:dTDP-glucose 4,6-dehydratase